MINRISVGSRYYTRVSGDASVQVEVVEDTKSGRKRYRIQRCDTGIILTRLRGPGELHTAPGPWGLSIPARKAAKVATMAPPPKTGKVPTMSDNGIVGLLSKLAAMPPDTRRMLSDLLAPVSMPPVAIIKSES